MMALFVLAVLLTAPVSANVVYSGDEAGTAVLYESKYTVPVAAPPTYEQMTGVLQVHATTSYLVTAGNTPKFTLINKAAPAGAPPAKEFAMFPDGTFEDRFVPGEFILHYGYCDIPVTINVGRPTVTALPDCDHN